jgi:septal ring factor EnvC (AmiA/AmiB activator)
MKEKMDRSALLFFSTTLVVLVTAVFLRSDTMAQTKKELQNKKDDLSKKIELTRKLIEESEAQQRNTTNLLQILNEQLRLREELVNAIGAEIEGIEDEIQQREQNLGTLENQLEAMKSEYASMVVQAYKNRSPYDKMMFVFASNDFNQAYRRMKVLQHYADARQNQLDMIRKTKDDVATNIKVLEGNREEKRQIAAQRLEEKNKIDKDKQKQQEKLKGLQSEEKKLRDKVKKQEKERADLENKIRKIIEDEIKASAKTTTSSTTPKAGTTPAASTSKFEVAPEAKIASADFEKNKGGLPWPVGSGVITSRFGKQAHPSVADLWVNNNGIDFSTPKGESVTAIFDGEVTSVFFQEGYGYNVIITKGLYKVVYGKLESASVKKGDKVSLKQKIGTSMNDGEGHVAHLEIWKIGANGQPAAQNPELWLKKR